METRAVLPDGSLRWERWVDTGIFDRSGRLVGASVDRPRHHRPEEGRAGSARERGALSGGGRGSDRVHPAPRPRGQPDVRQRRLLPLSRPRSRDACSAASTTSRTIRPSSRSASASAWARPHAGYAFGHLRAGRSPAAMAASPGRSGPTPPCSRPTAASSRSRRSGATSPSASWPSSPCATARRASG